MLAVISKTYAAIRSTARAAYKAGDVQLAHQNSGGDRCVAQALPERSEIVRLGYSFGAQIPLASAWTLLISVPTTLSNLALQNAEPLITGKSYIIDRFWVKNTTSTASAGFITPLAQVVIPGTALVADDTAVLRYSLSGAKVASSVSQAVRTKSQLVMNSIITGCLGDQWMHFGSMAQVPTTNLGAVVEVSCYGRYIVPPQGSFNINAQESVSGGVAIAGVEWHEFYLDLG